MVKDHPERIRAKREIRIETRCCATRLLRAQDDSAGAAGSLGAGVYHCVFECRQPILARSVRREGELAVRSALGASSAALRRTLLAESLLLCGAGG